jgi:hypothetical protein
MAHCDLCCLRVRVNKDKTLPKHYSANVTGVFTDREQEVCKGSGTTRYTPNSRFGRYGRTCSRPLSKQVCPSCGRKPLTLNKNGKFPKHKAPDGGTCSMSEANYPR